MGILEILFGAQPNQQTADAIGLVASPYQRNEAACPACAGACYFYDPEREQNEVCPTCCGSGVVEE